MHEDGRTIFLGDNDNSSAVSYLCRTVIHLAYPEVGFGSYLSECMFWMSSKNELGPMDELHSLFSAISTSFSILKS